MADPYGYLRSCGSCSAHVLSYASRDDEPVLCKKCLPGLMTAEEQLAQPHPRLRLYGRPSYTEFVVLFRDGEDLVVRRMGFPDEPSINITINMVKPQFSYAKLSRARSAERRKAYRR